MGCVYDRNKRYPERGPNIWVKYQDPNGEYQYEPIGRVNPKGLTKAQVKKKERDLRRLAKDVLAKVEGDVVAGRYELPRRKSEPLFKDAGKEWAERRKKTHRAARHDVGRMNNHLIPFFGEMRLSRISGNAGLVREYILTKLDEVGGGTVERTLMLLSRFFNDQIESGERHLANPVTGLDRATRQLATSNHDPKKVPFLKTKAEIRNVLLGFPTPDALDRPYRVMFGVGVFAGLRTSEILALDWRRDIDLGRRRIHVQWQVKEGKLATLKDRDSRVVLIVDTLHELLTSWRVVSGGRGLLFPPHPTRGGRPSRPPTFRRMHTMHDQLRTALEAAELPEIMTWYQSTRHTFASHWVMEGGSLEKLRELLGHSSVKVTERYAHFGPDMYCQRDFQTLQVDLSEPRVIPLRRRERSSS